MYLVDTSIWIHALRPSGSSAIQSRLKPLIADGQTVVTEWILLELMTGLPKNQEPDALLHWFAPVTRMPFDPRWWSTAWNPVSAGSPPPSGPPQYATTPS
ncbi:MAG: hypothetical protein OEU68_18160 [Nitrospira sp.]|nr:hypothetical protein [Nitrospira sp.]MDH4244996.1 hypothetical protein [Nitrospira sp.]MDH4356569.1 hypothetical protein [Nitrospira sp.]MDH5319950.1 hypothetical protein [Nitrospira sp.]